MVAIANQIAVVVKQAIIAASMVSTTAIVVVNSSYNYGINYIRVKGTMAITFRVYCSDWKNHRRSLHGLARFLCLLDLFNWTKITFALESFPTVPPFFLPSLFLFNSVYSRQKQQDYALSNRFWFCFPSTMPWRDCLL